MYLLQPLLQSDSKNNEIVPIILTIKHFRFKTNYETLIK